MPGKKSWLWPLLLFGVVLLGRQWYFTPSVGTAELAKDFTATRLDGQTFSLSDLRGSYVLLDFWGSWCGPCRQESPRLVELANDFPELTIVSVALERNRERWLNAVARDGKYWPHQVMDETTSLRFLNGEIADLYGVNEVPTHFLIAPDGQVVAVDASFLAIRQTLGDAR